MPQAKYRIAHTDKYDIQYAQYVKNLYRYLPENLQKEFNEFTIDLLKEDAISRPSLLTAVMDFGEEKFLKIREGCDFVNGAYNYRPYCSW